MISRLENKKLIFRFLMIFISIFSILAYIFTMLNIGEFNIYSIILLFIFVGAIFINLFNSTNKLSIYIISIVFSVIVSLVSINKIYLNDNENFTIELFLYDRIFIFMFLSMVIIYSTITLAVLKLVYLFYNNYKTIYNNNLNGENKNMKLATEISEDDTKKYTKKYNENYILNFIENYKYVIVALIVFISMFIFFYLVHPLYIYDHDDWTYISYSRLAIPNIHEWNRTKVLPETLFPFLSHIAVNVIYPITNDYVGSLAFIFAIAFSLIISIYIISIVRFLESYERLNISTFFAISIMILLSHFFPFNVNQSQNSHLFYAYIVNAIFNYTIPGLLNFILVMIMLTKKEPNYFVNQNHMVRSSIFVLLIYLAINSNMYHSIIIVTFMSIEILFDFINNLKNNNIKDAIIKTFNKNLIYFIVIVMWFISIFIEAGSSRASATYGKAYNLSVIIVSFNILCKSINNLNFYFKLFIIVTNLFGIFLYFIKSNKKVYDTSYIVNTIKFFIAIMTIILYLTLLTARTVQGHITFAAVMMCFLIPAILMTFNSIIYIIRSCSFINLFVPLMLYILIFHFTMIDDKTFADLGREQTNYDIRSIKIIGNYIIEQAKEANERDANEVTIYVPPDWMLARIDFSAGRLSNTFFRHRITNKRINVKIEVDESLIDKFHLSKR